MLTAFPLFLLVVISSSPWQAVQSYAVNLLDVVLQHWRREVVVSDMGRCRMARAALLRMAALVPLARARRAALTVAAAHHSRWLLRAAMAAWTRGIVLSKEHDMLLVANIVRRRAECTLLAWQALAYE